MLSPGRPAVSIRTLGMFHITRDGLPVPATAWQSPKGTELLKILITQRGPVSRKHLIDLLWPQADPAVASNQLSVLLSAIRQVLQPSNGTEPLGSDGSEVWLDHAGVVVDVEQFLTLAVAALHAHRSNQRNATALLHAAATAYTGTFFQTIILMTGPSHCPTKSKSPTSPSFRPSPPPTVGRDVHVTNMYAEQRFWLLCEAKAPTGNWTYFAVLRSPDAASSHSSSTKRSI